jgi:nucleotide-binding universal stress UspA family protein
MGLTAAAAAPRCVVVGVAGSAAAVAAVAWAAREAELRGIVLHAVHAWQPAARGRAPYAPGLPGQASHGDERAAAATLLRTVVRQGLDAVPPGLFTAAPLLETAEGPAVRALLRCAAGAELLVLGGSPGGPAPDLGPVARDCLRAAPCPVVTVSPQHVRQLAPGLVRSLAGALS